MLSHWGLGTKSSTFFHLTVAFFFQANTMLQSVSKGKHLFVFHPRRRLFFAKHNPVKSAALSAIEMDFSEASKLLGNTQAFKSSKSLRMNSFIVDTPQFRRP